MIKVSESTYLTTEVRAARGLYSHKLVVEILELTVMDTLQGCV